MDKVTFQHSGTILCATDFSPSSVAATGRAARIAQTSGARLELMHVIPFGAAPVYRMSGWQNDRQDVMSEAAAKLESAAAEVRAKFGCPVHAHLAFGIPHVRIRAHADATGARLLVVGSRGQRSVRDLFIGSTAYELRRTLRVPLLVARNRSQRPYARVLVAVDFSVASAFAARTAARLFPDATLHFIHVCSPLFASRLAMADGGRDFGLAHRNQALLTAGRELDSFIRDNGLEQRRGSSLVKHGYPPTCISNAAAESGTSLVAFGTRSRSRLATLMASVGKEFLSDSGPDALLVKPSRDLTRDRWRDVGQAELALT